MAPACTRCAVRTTCKGASDAGLIPMVFPDYQPVADADDPGASSKTAWGKKLDPNPGLTVVEITKRRSRRVSIKRYVRPR